MKKRGLYSPASLASLAFCIPFTVSVTMTNRFHQRHLEARQAAGAVWSYPVLLPERRFDLLKYQKRLQAHKKFVGLGAVRCFQ